MAAELSILALQEDFEELAGVDDVSRWNVEALADLEVVVTLSPVTDPNEKYQARLLWSKYPDEAPSLKFRDPATGRLDLPQAWPVVTGFRPTSLDACVNYSQEGFALHPEWRKDPNFAWNSTGNRVLWILRTLQDELDNHYQGRFKQ
jgi:hypothetical protein